MGYTVNVGNGLFVNLFDGGDKSCLYVDDNGIFGGFIRMSGVSAVLPFYWRTVTPFLGEE